MEINWERKSEPRTGKTWREGRGLEEDEMKLDYAKREVSQ